MELVRAALGHGVGDAAGGTTVLGRVARCVYLKLANRRLANKVRDAGAAALFSEERLIVVATVYGIVVEQARNSAEADQTKRAVVNCAGRKYCEVRPAAAINW